jgi:TonB-dependent starch-binding outer membrane protein SusC
MKRILLIMCLLLLAPYIYARQAAAETPSIRGVVTDEKGEHMVGVYVKIQNKDKTFSAGTTSDENGVFVFRNLKDNIYTLTFTFLGYQKKTIDNNVYKKGDQLTLSVEMSATPTALNDVVVLGYGSVRKKDLTGSVSKADMNDLNKAPIRSIDEALEGRLAGVVVSSVDGQPGSAINIVIRGNNSISQDNSPLYIIDGLPIENPDLNMLTPAEVESITVLKDASATAIYGARGSNGVVIINTVHGKEGAPQLSLNASYGLQQNIKTADLMSPYEFVKYQLELNPNTTDPKSPYNIFLGNQRTLDYYKTATPIDWQSQMFRTAPMQNYSMQLTGGNAKTKYAMTGSVLDQDGTIINSGYKRYQGRISVDQTVNTHLKVGLNVAYSYLQRQGISPSESGGNVATTLLYSLYGSRPVAGIADSTLVDDDLFDPTIDLSSDYRINPIINQKNLLRNKKSKVLNANAYAEYTILPDLILRVTGGLNDNNQRNEAFNNSNTLYGSKYTVWGSAYGVNGNIGFSDDTYWVNENTLTWNKHTNGHSFNVLAGVTEQGSRSSDYAFGAANLPNESLGLSGLEEGAALPIKTQAATTGWTMASFLGRINYDYKSKYFATFSYRADGSSKFATQNRWGYFPSGALAWRFSEENFVKNTGIFSDGKLRASYGLTGNNRVTDFGYLATYALPIQSTYIFNNGYQQSIIPQTIANPKLKWETTAQLDLGLDLGFFNNRLTATADVYRKKTYDLLLNAALPASTGYATAFKNIGSIRNQGLELAIQATPVQTKAFTWNASFNIAFNQSKVLSLTEGQESITTAINWDNNWSTLPGYISKIGMPIGNMYGYKWDGVYQYKDFSQATDGSYILKDNVAGNGKTRANIQPGDIKYKDLNGDGVVNSNDYTVIGRGLPIHTGGFNNNFQYKNFDLNVFFQWSYGNDIYDIQRLVYEGNAFNKPYLNQFASYEDRWTPTHTNTNMFRAGGFYGGGYSSRTVEDGSYLRLKTLSLGYNLPAATLKRAGIQRVHFYVSAQNVLTFTGYKGLDPEVSTYNSVLTPGFDYSAYPRGRTYVVGANVNF